MSEIRTTKIDGQEFVTLTDYLRLKEEKQELEYLWDINEELKEENKKLKYVIDSVMEKAGIEYIRLADWDVFMNPKNKLHISDTIQVDILNHNK
jgi:hypothetical protein